MERERKEIIGRGTTLRGVFRIVEKVAPTDSTVLVTGESGTGKELIVRCLHEASPRAGKPFVAVNCGAIPRDLLESELFGYEKGAFTGAVTARAGRFELAQGGTIFLDEIGEMDPALQVKLLRVLQEKEVEHVGGSGPHSVDVRVVAATNRDLEAEVEAGRFREDLFYRLNVIPIQLPALRERRGDVPLLAQAFLRRFCQLRGRGEMRLAPEARAVLEAYPWPGNVRELENCMERVSILAEGDSLEAGDLPAKIRKAAAGTLGCASAGGLEAEDSAGSSAGSGAATGPADAFRWPELADLERLGMGLRDFLAACEDRLVEEALASSQNQHAVAARLLGVKRTTLIEKLRRKGRMD
ncbi:MAG: sigma 54-interacting transcriptional regulator [Desulfovibrio sp.]|nr:sigma 54-interacting transcriptional regulator [Desulfovibrio sp.]